MRRIAIIGANDFQNPLILRAKELGFETHVFAWAAGDIGEQTADYFYPISIVEKDRILEECRRIGVDAVVSIASDLAVLTVNHIARELSLPCNDEQTDRVSTNKFLMRNAFEMAGLPTPKHIEVDSSFCMDRTFDLNYPLIVKPTDRSGSRGVSLVETPEKLPAAIEHACAEAFSKKAIVEEFIEGPEYSCECISWNGKHRVLAFTQKYTTGAPNFIESGQEEPSDIPADKLPELERGAIAALDALNICWGAAHVEFRLNQDGEMRLIEVGARMGGDCIGSDLVLLSTGYDYLRMVIDVAQGKEPDFTKVRTPKRARVQFAFNETEVKGLKEMCRKHPNQVWRCSEMGSENYVVTDSSTRLGFCIFYDEIVERKNKSRSERQI